ncbi:MAG: DNA-directed RNA polymerase subunit beta' [Pseudomonadota bacterium]|nr:DNA-directed RNA polymerase subunit beta' [Pseudomonadota bacterium]
MFDFSGDDEDRVENDSLSINILSPEKIKAMSYGEVKKPETINYRTFKPERDGLFCSKIFGPMKDYECLCGKYKRMKHRGVVCEKCGVEVTLTKVRRERMGHISLAAPVAHIWFLKSLPSRIGLLLDMNLRDIERVLYFEAYIVVNPGVTDLQHKQLLSEEAYIEAVEQHGDDFVALMGAEAIKYILDDMNIDLEVRNIREQIEMTSSETRLKRLMKRVRILESIAKSKNKASWMILTELPVLPPDLRPLVPLDGGRFATSDLNDLYRRVINRNNRLKRLLEMSAPEIIVRNEKRMLQESVDALFDNGRRGRAITGTNKRPLKSLADMIKGKSGRFRQNLLGKRVDYSGRSVIVVGPTLKLHQCGIPKRMALELFKPFIFSRLQRLDLCTTIKSAKQMVENEEAPVWDALDEVIKEHPVMLNRAPTLHRLGIQAFEPILIEGKAIQLHPLVCKAYNADFDGDTMSVHVPLSIEAQLEARCLMMSTNNILSPANGKPIIVPDKDVVLGLYYLTKERVNALGEGMTFNSCEECRRAYYVGFVSLHAKVKVRMNPDDSESGVADQIVETTVGRIIFWEIIPSGIQFSLINKVMKSSDVSNLIHECVHDLGPKKTVVFADQFMYLGFKYASKSGISIGIDDLMIPKEKLSIVSDSEKSVREIEDQFASGLLTNGERYNKIVDTWTHAGLEVEKAMRESISVEEVQSKEGKTVVQGSFNSLYVMADSGARGSVNQMRQLVGMRGLMTRPDGSFIETAVTSNFKEGLSVMQYFTSTHGARKGLADTALKTASSGYLTRRLVDVAQDVVVVSHDCGTERGIEMIPHIQGGEVVEGLRERVTGRVLSEDIVVDDKVLLTRNTLLGDEEVSLLEYHGIDRIHVRSPILCDLKKGICSMCYGRDLARGCMVNIGEAVGVIAAQSIGEPGTQLSMRTFHIGGAASRATAENSIQVRATGTVRLHDMKTVVHHETGELIAISRSGVLTLLDSQGRECERYKLPYGTTLKVKDGQAVKSGMTVAEWDPYTHPIIAEVAGKVDFVDFIEGVTITRQTDELTGLSTITVLQDQATKDARAMVRLLDSEGNSVYHPGTKVPANYFLTAGSIVNLEVGHMVGEGDVIARIPKEGYKTTDITGGLPRVSDIFEARKPKDSAILAPISGVVSMGKETKDKKRLTITDQDGNKYEELVPKWRSVTVFEGESVEKGEVVVDGPDDPHSILRLKGTIELARYIINEVQDVYRLQGVGINDKHIEIIIRQMLKKVLITQSGDLGYLPDEVVEKYVIEEENKELLDVNPDATPASYVPVLLGITKSSLSTESFISAASFQETTRVLTEASISGSKDYLIGLKENVLVGRLIPAGTGFKSSSQVRSDVSMGQIDDASSDTTV